MPANTGKKDACRSLYAQGLSGLAIAKKLGISRGTVDTYKKQDRGTERDWDKHRADLKGKTPPPRPNLVTFERPRGGSKGTTPQAPKIAADDMDLTAIINGAIASVASQLSTADNLQGVGGAASGLATLVRLKLELEDPEVALQEIMAKYRHPHKLIEALREQGWGRETA
jgi:hypothetical protein